MRSVIWLILVLTASLLGACDGPDQCGGDPCSEHVFEPLAHAKIHLGGRIGDLDKLVDAFAARRRLAVARANVRLDKRWINHIQITITEKGKTSISIENFRDVNIAEAVVYSHAGKEVWRDAWKEFLAAAAREFGSGNVEVLNTK